MQLHKNISIFGQVQGVSLRAAARQEANRLDITGFVENRSNGSLYIEAEGEEARLLEFVGWCGRGTAWSKIERVEVADGEVRDFQDFTIKRSFL